MSTEDPKSADSPLFEMIRKEFSLGEKSVLGLDEISAILDFLHGKHLSYLIRREWEIQKTGEILAGWEIEHGKSLALIFQNEAQKIQLEDLNNKLTESIRIKERDMKMAEKVQQSLLVQSPPDTENYDVAFHYQPFASVSGDFYDFYTSGSKELSGVVVADISGHGIASSLITALAKPVFFRNFRQYANEPLETVMTHVNRQLIEDMEGTDSYLTAILLRFSGNMVEYINAAHPDAIVRSREKNFCGFIRPNDEPVQSSILGLAHVEYPFTSHKVELLKNDVLVIYTDCLLEARDKNGREIGEERIFSILDECPPELSADGILKKIISVFNAHRGDRPLDDDLTIVVLKKK